jgi:hypothetical protein
MQECEEAPISYPTNSSTAFQAQTEFGTTASSSSGAVTLSSQLGRQSAEASAEEASETNIKKFLQVHYFEYIINIYELMIDLLTPILEY